MIEKLFHMLQKPKLWQRSTEAFWDGCYMINIEMLLHMLRQKNTCRHPFYL